MRAFGLALLFFALLFGALALMPEKEKLPTVEELDSQVDDVWYGVYFDARKLGWSHHTFAKGVERWGVALHADGARDAADTGETADNRDSADSADSADCLDAPVGDAGAAQTVNLSDGHVQLNGSASGGCGPFTWFWAFQAVPSHSVVRSNDIRTYDIEDPTFAPDTAGTYVLSLSTYDGAQWSTPDMVEITVL